MTETNQTMIQDQPTHGQSGNALQSPALVATARKGYVAFPYEILDTFFFTDKKGRVRKLNASERAVLAALLGDVHQGKPMVEVDQARLVDKAGVCKRTVRDAIHALNLAGLIKTKILKNRAQRIIGSLHNLAGALRMLPEKTLKYLRLDWLLRLDPAANFAPGPQQNANGQGALPLDEAPADSASQMAQNAASSEAENTPSDEGSQRQNLPHSEQEQTLFVKQHTPAVRDEKPLPPDPNTDRGVVALLAARGVGWARAWLCVKVQKRAYCLEWLAAFPYLSKPRNPGGYLADAILKRYGFPPGYLSARAAAHAKEQARAAAPEREKARVAAAEAAQAKEQEKAELNAQLDALSPAEHLSLAREVLAETRSDAALGIHLRRFIDAIVAKPDAPVPPASHFVRATLVAKLIARKDC